MANANGDIKKRFGSYEIVWSIKNFSFCSAFRSIESSEFTLEWDRITKWKLSLGVSVLTNEEEWIFVALERLLDDGHHTVDTSWEITLSVIDKSFNPVKFDVSLQTKTVYRKILINVDDILDEFETFGSDALNIYCKLIVYNGESVVKKPPSFEKPPDGIRVLFSNLEELRKQEEYADIILEIGKETIKSHKAILSRNETLKKLIEQESGGVLQITEDLDYEEVSKFINFLYSGNVDVVLNKPTISMAKCIKYFNDISLKSYYVEEQVYLNSSINIEENTFFWVIRNFLHRSGEVTCPVIIRQNESTSWQVKVDLRSENDDNIFMAAEIIRGEEPHLVALEFGIKINKEAVAYLHAAGYLTDNWNNGAIREEFVKKSTLKSSITEEDDVCIVFKISALYEKKTTSSIGRRKLSLVRLSGQSHYEKLSSEIAKLLEGEFSDITIGCKGGECKAHKCILSARSPVFREKMKIRRSKSSFVITNMTHDILEILLEYIYSGVLKNLEVTKLMHAYNASNFYKITSMKTECEQKLRSTINRENIASARKEALAVRNKDLLRIIEECENTLEI